MMAELNKTTTSLIRESILALQKQKENQFYVAVSAL